MTGGAYSLTGGFSSLITVVQTPGAPNLTLFTSPVRAAASTSPGPGTGGYTLQQSRNLAVAGNWAASGYPVSSANGYTNSVTITTPGGKFVFPPHQSLKRRVNAQHEAASLMCLFKTIFCPR